MDRLHLKAALIFALFIALLFVAQPSFGQQQILESLNNAEKLYEQGKPSQALATLKANSSILVDKTARWRGYKLATLCYLALNDADSARLMAGRLMSINPTFTPNSITDPTDFHNIMYGFEPYANVRFGILGAASVTAYNAIVQRNPGDFVKTYTPEPSFGIGIAAEFRLKNHWWIGTNLINSPFRQLIQYAAADWQVRIDEEISALHIPLFLSYQNEGGSLGYSFSLGPYLSMIGNSTYTASFTSSRSSENITEQKINSSKEKAQILNGWAFNGRLWRPALKGFWFAQLQLTSPLNSVNIFNYETLNRDMLSEFYFLPDDVLPVKLSLQVGYLFSLSYRVKDEHKGRK